MTAILPLQWKQEPDPGFRAEEPVEEKLGDTEHLPRRLSGARAASLWDLHRPYFYNCEREEFNPPRSGPTQLPIIGSSFKRHLGNTTQQLPGNLETSPCKSHLNCLFASFSHYLVHKEQWIFYYFVSSESWHIADLTKVWGLTKLGSEMDG